MPPLFVDMPDIYSVTALYFDSTSVFIYLLFRHFPSEVNEVLLKSMSTALACGVYKRWRERPDTSLESLVN